MDNRFDGRQLGREGAREGSCAGDLDAAQADTSPIDELIDAVSGATWQTRNRIMRDRFMQSLDDSENDFPTYRPPG